MPVSPSSALLLILCGALPVSAQLIEVPSAKLTTSGNKVDSLGFAENPSFASDKALSGVYQLPTVQKTSGDLSEGNPVYVNQDVLTLSARRSAVRKVENVLWSFGVHDVAVLLHLIGEEPDKVTSFGHSALPQASRTMSIFTWPSPRESKRTSIIPGSGLG